MTLENFNYRTNPMFLRNQFPSDNIYGIPSLPKAALTGEEQEKLMLIAFNSLKSDNANNSERFVHFFIYDYNFEKLWTKPDESLELLSQYKGILTPDFSMYLEMPYALQLYNTFRNRWCGAYFASKGVRVIPTVSWGDDNTFEFCFKGIPKGSVVAVSTYMFHAHNNHADQKDVFMKGYNRMLTELEPSAIICYSEPFPEMEGNIIYMDYELNSWRYLKDDKPTSKYVKRTLSNSRQSDIYVHKTYICKGGGSAYGGKWQPKKEADEKLLGKPNSTKKMHIPGKKGGYDAEIKYDEQGRAVLERHYTDHNKPWAHSNPHDHEYSWEHDYPQRVGTRNYFDGNIPEIDKRWRIRIMNEQSIRKNEDDVLIIPYKPEQNRFETLGEFKIYIDAGWELSFEYHGVEYGIDKLDDGLFYIGNCDERICIQEKLTLEQVLNFEIDGVKIRDFITTDDVEITDRPGPM